MKHIGFKSGESQSDPQNKRGWIPPRINDPYKESRQPSYTPLVKLKDEEILKAAAKRFGACEAAGTWLDPNRDAGRQCA